MKTIYIYIIAVALLIAGAAAVYLYGRKRKDGNTSTDTDTSTDTETNLPKNVVVGSFRMHNGRLYHGAAAEPAFTNVNDRKVGSRYYKDNLIVNTDTFAKAVQGIEGNYKFNKDESTGKWLVSSSYSTLFDETPVDPADFGISNYDIPYNGSGFSVMFVPARPAMWKAVQYDF